MSQLATYLKYKTPFLFGCDSCPDKRKNTHDLVECMSLPPTELASSDGFAVTTDYCGAFLRRIRIFLRRFRRLFATAHPIWRTLWTLIH